MNSKLLIKLLLIICLVFTLYFKAFLTGDWFFVIMISLVVLIFYFSNDSNSEGGFDLFDGDGDGGD